MITEREQRVAAQKHFDIDKRAFAFAIRVFIP